MRLYNGLDVLGAAVADFDLVSVEDFVQLMLLWEMEVDEGQELLSNVGSDGSTERGIIPCDVAFSVFLFVSWLVHLFFVFIIFKCVLVPALF